MPRAYAHKLVPVKREPPPQRAKVLAFIREEVARRNFPTLKAISAHMGWKNESSAHAALCALVGDGHLRVRRVDDRGYWELVP